MKSILTIVLSFTIVFNSIGNIVIFYIYQNSIRQEIMSLLKSDKIKKKIELLKFSKKDIRNKLVKFVKSDEFIYNNQLYDIKRSKAFGDSIYYYCINDTKEKDLIDNFSKDYHKKTEQTSKTNTINLKLQLSDYLLSSVELLRYNLLTYIKSDYYKNFYTSIKLDLKTKPPSA